MANPRDELINSLSKAFEEGTYSDLTIVTTSSEYKVHKVLVCGRSEFFKTACNSRFKEGQSNVIELLDDDPQAVELMLHYLYTLDYPCAPDVDHDYLNDSGVALTTLIDLAVTVPEKSIKKKKKKFRSNSIDSSVHSHEHVASIAYERAPNLLIHARLYALGEKYGIRGLKKLSLAKFREEVVHFWNTDDFLGAVEEIYTSTIDQDRDLRDVAVDVIVKRPQILDDERAQSIIKGLDLCFDLMMEFRKRCMDRGW